VVAMPRDHQEVTGDARMRVNENDEKAYFKRKDSSIICV
jgi:hypothetical protein